MTSRVGCTPRTKKEQTHDEGLDCGLHAKKWLESEPQTPRSSFVVTYMSQRPDLYHTAVLLPSQPETCLTAPAITTVITPTPFLGTEQKRLFHRQSNQNSPSVSVYSVTKQEDPSPDPVITRHSRPNGIIKVEAPRVTRFRFEQSA